MKPFGVVIVEVSCLLEAIRTNEWRLARAVDREFKLAQDGDLFRSESLTVHAVPLWCPESNHCSLGSLLLPRAICRLAYDCA